MRATTIEGQNSCSNAVVEYVHVTDGQTHVIRLQVIEVPNARDQIALCTFHSFLVEVQTNAGYIRVRHA